MTDRVARLREQLEEPLLVTNPKNVLYLVGFDSSNAVLLVDDEREEWRRISVIRDIVSTRFVGLGPDGYRLALQYLKENA